MGRSARTRKTSRPILPNPLMPTRNATTDLLVQHHKTLMIQLGSPLISPEPDTAEPQRDSRFEISDSRFPTRDSRFVRIGESAIRLSEKPRARRSGPTEGDFTRSGPLFVGLTGYQRVKPASGPSTTIGEGSTLAPGRGDEIVHLRSIPLHLTGSYRDWQGPAVAVPRRSRIANGPRGPASVRLAGTPAHCLRGFRSRCRPATVIPGRYAPIPWAGRATRPTASRRGTRGVSRGSRDTSTVTPWPRMVIVHTHRPRPT